MGRAAVQATDRAGAVDPTRRRQQITSGARGPIHTTVQSATLAVLGCSPSRRGAARTADRGARPIRSDSDPAGRRPTPRTITAPGPARSQAMSTRVQRRPSSDVQIAFSSLDDGVRAGDTSEPHGVSVGPRGPLPQHTPPRARAIERHSSPTVETNTAPMSLNWMRPFAETRPQPTRTLEPWVRPSSPDRRWICRNERPARDPPVDSRQSTTARSQRPVRPRWKSMPGAVRSMHERSPTRRPAGLPSCVGRA